MTAATDRGRSVVVVSGGSRGIGRAIVDALIRRGDRVATFSRSPWPGAMPMHDPEKAPGELLWRQLDATDSTAVRNLIRAVEERWGRVDALVNNAGIAVEGVLAMAREEDMQAMLDVNVKGALILAKECVRLMLVQGGGTIVNVSSIIAERGFAGLAVYAATKGALASMTRSLARELGPRHIRVNTLAPGFVETEMSASLDERQRQQIVRRTPLGRLATADDIVPVVEFLLSPASRFITGQTIVVDGGASV